MLQGCVGAGPVKQPGGESVVVNSSYYLTHLNREVIEPVFDLWLNPGAHQITVIYPTLRYDYHCVFNWLAEPLQRYEVIHQEKKQPLVMYRWVRKNALWAEREDPVYPVCKRKKN